MFNEMGPGFHTISAGEDNEVYLQPDIEYLADENQRLNIHLLRQTNQTESMPLIIWIQGSAWGHSRPQDTYRFIPELVRFAKKGYVVASIQHRTSHEAIFPAQIQDVKTAIRFLKKYASKYKIDKDRIGVWGDSSGGHLAALAGTSTGVEAFEGSEYRDQSSNVQAVVDWYGPTDFLRMNDFPSMDHNAPDSPESTLIGGAIQENQEKVQKANPINYISPYCPPFLIMHGDKDELVPYNQSELLYHALREAGHQPIFYKIENGGHGKGFKQEQVMKIVEKFLDKHLMN